MKKILFIGSLCVFAAIAATLSYQVSEKAKKTDTNSLIAENVEALSSRDALTYGYRPSVHVCPYPVSYRKSIVCGSLVTNGTQKYCVNSDC